MCVCSYMFKLSSVLFSFNSASIKLKVFNVLLSKILTFPAWSVFRAESSCFARLLGSLAKFYQSFLRFSEVMNQLLSDQYFPTVIFGRYDCFHRGAVVFYPPLFSTPDTSVWGKKNSCHSWHYFPDWEMRRGKWWELVIIWSW